MSRDLEENGEITHFRGQRGRPRRDGAPAWDDVLADTVALVNACRADDGEGVGAVLRHGDRDMMLCTAVKLLAEVSDELRAGPVGFRLWAQEASQRP